MTAPARDEIWALERLVRRDRTIIGGALLLLTALSWMYLFRMAGGGTGPPAGQATAMPDMPGMAMPDMRAWMPADVLVLFVMWAVMMVAMMLPSAAPTILLVVAALRRRGERASQAAAACFVVGYLFVWTAFSAGAALAQWLLHRQALLSSEMASTSLPLGGGLLIAAGIYQWLPVKYACLTACRSPIDVISREWREGAAGAVVMGFRHGLFCLGCCWILMLLLFVAGVMNLAWIATIGAFVLVEKLAPRGIVIGRLAGALLVAWGFYTIVQPLAHR